MTTPDRGGPPPPPRLRRSVLGRPLSWRNPWTLLLCLLAAFQGGAIVTLLVSTRDGASDRDVPPPPTAAPAPSSPYPHGTLPPAGHETPGPAAPATTAPPTPAPPPPPRGPRRRPPTPDPHRPAVTPSAGLIEVDIITEPEGATVRIGGAVWGVTPLTAYLPATRPVVMHLELAGHAPTKLSWAPGSGTRTVRATLAPLESP